MPPPIKGGACNSQRFPYKGGAAAITVLIGGQVDMAFAPLPEALPYIKSGKLFAVGVLSEKRAVSAPDIPTLREGGINNVVLSAWIGLLAPVKTPQPVLDKLSKSAKAFLRGDAKKKQADRDRHGAGRR